MSEVCPQASVGYYNYDTKEQAEEALAKCEQDTGLPYKIGSTSMGPTVGSFFTVEPDLPSSCDGVGDTFFSYSSADACASKLCDLSKKDFQVVSKSLWGFIPYYSVEPSKKNDGSQQLL